MSTRIARFYWVCIFFLILIGILMIFKIENKQQIINMPTTII